MNRSRQVKSSSFRPFTVVVLVASEAVAWTACTGDDPAFVQPFPTADSSVANADALAPADSSVSETGSTDTGLPPTQRDPACLQAAIIPCAPSQGFAGAALHLDACTLGTAEGMLSTWTPLKGPSPVTTGGSTGTRTGARLCASQINGRPGVVFNKGANNGFVILPAQTEAFNYVSDFTIVAVLQYTARTDNTGDVIFQRSASGDAANGFPGPTLLSNIVYPDALGSTNITSHTTKLGLQVRFGPAPSAIFAPTMMEGYSITAGDKSGKPLVIVAQQTGTTLTLRVNTKESTTDLPEVFASKGNGEEVHIGHTSQDSNSFVGTLSELAYFTAPLTFGEVTAIEQKLMTKWAIAAD